MNADPAVCPSQPDGKHRPITHHWSADADPNWVYVRCDSCFRATGYPIERFAEQLDWT